MFMHTHVNIEYANPLDQNDSITLSYKLRNNSIVPKWIKKLKYAQALDVPIDDPTRFYGFGSMERQIEQAIDDVQKQIFTINSYKHIIDRQLSSVEDQDTLNYLHHIFEVFHGLLNNPSDFFLSAPVQVQKSLSNLNIAVHRCESVARGSRPRHVITYFGLKKDQVLNLEDYQHFTEVSTFGCLCLNYVEIGKTLRDLALDSDQYISEEAFKPFTYYSADFTVKFYNSDPIELEQLKNHVSNYYKQHAEFFMNRGLDENHPYLKSGIPPLADIDNAPSNVLKLLETRQFVKSISLI